MRTEVGTTGDPPWGCGKDVLVLRLRQPDHADHLVRVRRVVRRQIEAIGARDGEALVEAMDKADLVQCRPVRRLETDGQRCMTSTQAKGGPDGGIGDADRLQVLPHRG